MQKIPETEEFIKEQAKVLGQQVIMSVISFVHKTGMYFAPKHKITVKMNNGYCIKWLQKLLHTHSTILPFLLPSRS
jgi:spore cortex formation protein SpoVR/YcgB (stage V sporulation)